MLPSSQAKRGFFNRGDQTVSGGGGGISLSTHTYTTMAMTIVVTSEDDTKVY